MSDRAILHGEPGYKLDEFVEEMLGRCRLVISEMGGTFESLLRAMIDSLDAFRSEHRVILLDDLKFDQMRWVTNGRLVIDFALRPKRVSDGDPDERLRHMVIDDFVDDILGRTVPEPLRVEFAQFVRGMVMQFAALKKHSLLDLKQVTFETPFWQGSSMIIGMRHRGSPFAPQQARME